MGIGKLYRDDEEQLVANVEYQLYDRSPTKLWGELITKEYKQLNDGEGYVIELEDGQKYQCSLKRRVNRAVSGIPPRFIYQFSNNGQ